MLGLGGLGTTIASAVIGGGILFMAGGHIIGDYKANRAKEECSRTQMLIVENAIKQAQELAEKWEEENAKSLRLQRRVEALQGELRVAETEIDTQARRRETEIARAAENLAACMLNEDTRDILNSWMLGNEYDQEPVS